MGCLQQRCGVKKLMRDIMKMCHPLPGKFFFFFFFFFFCVCVSLECMLKLTFNRSVLRGLRTSTLYLLRPVVFRNLFRVKTTPVRCSARMYVCQDIGVGVARGVSGVTMVPDARTSTRMNRNTSPPILQLFLVAP